MVCRDEKPVPLHADVRPPSPAQPGREARYDKECERCGAANVFCAVEPKAGRLFTFARPDRSGLEFAQVAVAWALAYPAAQTIPLVKDHLNLHRQKSLAEVFGAEMAAEVWARFPVHHTLPPAAGSIKRRSKSGSSRGHVWERDEFLTWRLSAAKRRPGIGE